jgi:PASTA domain
MWRCKGFWIVAGSVAALLLIVALTSRSDQTGSHAAPTSAPVQSTALATTAASSSIAAPTTTPPTTIPKVGVPRLVGMTMARAQRVLSDRGLRGSVTYKTTARYATGTVISQSRKAGTSVAPGAVVTLVIAKAPPPTTPPSTAPARNCDPAYPDACLHDGIGDYDCKGGSGNGPNYVEGPITVLPPDPFDLDRDGDGVGCEQG